MMIGVFALGMVLGILCGAGLCWGGYKIFKRSFGTTTLEPFASRLLENSEQRLAASNKERIDAMLQPFRVQVENLARDVKDSTLSQTSLRGTLQQMSLDHKNIAAQAENLVSALKGKSQTRGQWGEMILEKVLEGSGLRKGQEYVLQESITNRESGERLRPDAVINLPQGKRIVVDAKTPLVDYERFSSTSDPLHLQAFLRSMRLRVKELAEKDYAQIETVGGRENLDFLLLFVPIESAFSLAMEEDKALMDYAWEHKVVIVSPSTLLLALRTIYYAWQSERQGRNAQDIAREGGKLYDKVAAFVEDMESHGKKLTGAQSSYDEAMKKLSSGRGNILERTRKLENLGVKTNKRLPDTHEGEGQE